MPHRGGSVGGAQECRGGAPLAFARDENERPPHEPIVLTIRPAQLTDSAALAGLVTQLGYVTSVEQMHRRLAMLLSLPDYQTFVGCMPDRVVGMVSVWLGYAIELDGRYGRITVIAVDERVRRQGVGRALMHHVEQWLRAQHAAVVTLTSAAHRREAHKFYESLGYDGNGVRFKKWLIAK